MADGKEASAQGNGMSPHLSVQSLKCLGDLNPVRAGLVCWVA